MILSNLVLSTTCVTLLSSLFPNYLWIFWTVRALLQIHLDSTADLSPLRKLNIYSYSPFLIFQPLRYYKAFEPLGGALLKAFRKPRWIKFSSPLLRTTLLYHRFALEQASWKGPAQTLERSTIKLSQCLGIPVLKLADPEPFMFSTQMYPTPATSSVTLSHTSSFDS